MLVYKCQTSRRRGRYIHKSLVSERVGVVAEAFGLHNSLRLVRTYKLSSAVQVLNLRQVAPFRLSVGVDNEIRLRM